jgi:replicative DNA helicase
VKAYYERDDRAKLVDMAVMTEQINATVQNEKHRERFQKFLDEAVATEVSSANVKDVVLGMKKNELSLELASAIANGTPHDKLLEEYANLSRVQSLDEFAERGVEVYENEAIDDLIEEEAVNENKLKVYPLSLNERLEGGLQGSDHVTLMARPEMGKTGLILTMATGFARQGQVGIVFNNEERVKRLRMRALCCATGMTAKEIRAEPDKAKDIAENHGFHNIIFVALSPGSPSQIEAFVKKYKAKWFIVDQLRNLAVKSDTKTNQLEEAAKSIRNIAKKYDAVAISVTQAGDSAEGKAVLSMGDVDSSNTGIPGACDVLLGIGATEEQKKAGIRVLSLSKNKIGGVHDDFPVRFSQFHSKYISIKDNE